MSRMYISNNLGKVGERVYRRICPISHAEGGRRRFGTKDGKLYGSENKTAKKKGKSRLLVLDKNAGL